MALGVRDYFSGKGYQVQYDAPTGNIRVYNPTSGASSVLQKGSYYQQNGNSYMNQDTANSIMGELTSNKYNLNNNTATKSLIKPTTATTQPQQQLTPSNYTTSLLNQKAPSNLAYAPVFQSLLNQMNSNVTKKTPEQLQTEATNKANLQIDPQITQLENNLTQAQTDAGNQTNSVNAAYTGALTELQNTANLQKQQAQESAIARGAGRSGVVDWNNNKINTDQTAQVGKVGASKAADLANIASQLASLQTQNGVQKAALEGQRGTLINDYMSQLGNTNQQDNSSNYQNMLSNIIAMTGQANSANQNANTYATNMMPYISQTANEAAHMPLEWTNTTNKIPNSGTGAVTLNTLNTPKTTTKTATPSIANETKYVQSLIQKAQQTNNPNLAKWAKQYAKSLGITI